MVTTVGKQRLASHLASAPSQTVFTHIAFGTGDTAATAADLALEAEILRVEFDSVYQDDRVCFGKKQVQGADFGDEDEYTIKELGVLDAASGGNLICRSVLATAITLAKNERLVIPYGVVQS